MIHRGLAYAIGTCLLFSWSVFFSAAQTTANNQKSNALGMPIDLSASEQQRIALKFAPILVFHKDEEYLPCSPLFPLEQTGQTSLDSTSLANLMGTAESRAAAYRALALEEKAQLAKVYYRIRRVGTNTAEQLIVDYWLYYVHNSYRVRGGLFPIWFDRSHPNDLEHFHVLLTPSQPIERGPGIRIQETWFKAEAVFSSAHEGTIPANRYYFSKEDLEPNTRLLVELGAHASAPDIDKDGLFEPGVDGRSGYKLLWGVRDRGYTWAWYRKSYADLRTEPASVVLFGSGSGLGPEDSKTIRFRYKLVPVKKLADQFEELGLSDSERKALFESNVHWLKRMTGKSNGDSHKLLVPPAQETYGNSLGVNGHSATERGIILGGTTMLDAPGLYLGGRYGVLHGTMLVPDLILEANGIVTSKGKGYLATQFLMAYPISVASKVMGGPSLLTNSLSFRQRQWDWVAGLETRLGHFQLYVGVRTTGSLNDEFLDFRLSYFF